ncbi:MAG TPA: cell division ATPase MinD [archaeon]|nr:cell division ATPase MinD [archaeon]
MGRCILITSGKGGVGKTTLTSNLAASLADMGYATVAVDANLTTPNLGIHLGMHLVARTLHDVLRGEEKIERAMYPHPLGFKIIPGNISVNSLQNVKYERLGGVVLKLLSQFDFVLLDSPAGLGEDTKTAIDSTNEIIIITNPDMPSVTDALKTIKHATKRYKKVLGIVVNRIRGASHELSIKEVEEMLGLPVIAAIPEDSTISKSIARKTPAVSFNSGSSASKEMNRLAHRIAQRHFYTNEDRNSLRKFFKIFGF